MSWKEVTLEQYYKIKDLTNIMDIIEVLSGDVLLKDFRASDYAFLNEEVPKEVVADCYVINGRKYVTQLDVRKFTVAQYVDYTNYTNAGRPLYETLSCFLIPEGKKYGEDIDIVHNDLKSLSIVDALAINNFFILGLVALLKAIQPYFESLEMKKEDKQKVLDLMESFCTLNLLLIGES